MLRSLSIAVTLSILLSAPFLTKAARANDPGNSVSESESSDDESSPEEILADFLAKQKDGRLGHYSQYTSSSAMPVDSVRWADLSQPKAAGPASYRVEIEVFKKPKGLGVDREFAWMYVDGQLKSIYVASTAMPGKYTIEGTFPITIVTARGKKNPAYKPFPWHKSATYNDSPMYWGLQIHGGFWIHSTPHYGQLGQPASKGCVRIDYPASMEIWDEIVNRTQGSAVIHIYGSGSSKAKAAFAARGLDPSFVADRIESDLQDALAVTHHDYHGYGHARMGQPLVWPACDGVDCFDYFGVRK